MKKIDEKPWDKPLRFRSHWGDSVREDDPRRGTCSYGCYFPKTDLVVGDNGSRGTGMPRGKGIEWIDDPTVCPWYEASK